MINYEDKFETIRDLEQSGIPVTFGEGTIVELLLATDPRSTVQRMNKNKITFPYAGGHAPLWVVDK